MRAVAFALTLSLFAPPAAASIVTTHEGAWRAEDESACVAENASPSPTLASEREELIPKESPARVDAAFGMQAGFGSPGGVGGYLGHTPEGTPVSLGWSAFLRAEVTALRPLWISAQTHAMTTPKIDGASFMSDVLVGWDFHGYGNTWSAMRQKRSSELAYECVFGRWDVAFVGGLKEVAIAGDPRMDNWHAVMGGVQLRLLRYLFGGTFGLDFDVLGVYDTSTHGAGAQLQDVLHAGTFVFSQDVGFAWHRGVWVTLGVGAGFDL
jgi:hypothetical protein